MNTKDVIREMNEKIRRQDKEIDNLVISLRTLASYRNNVLFDQHSHGKRVTDGINIDFDKADKLLQKY